ncbi:Transglycosylase-associated protein [Mesorhizobium metallidurans STM 2683]|uniref:Transglycosylase-associated protein n=1 Tax=Mesorhizobium metallidurans STM 2683 TaxID=1297569 RepID=M5F4Q6_9HYPH|nr:GlsB/YeaQ/YmgE family stress response membrane protein [Mesorhizobium metallidurans]CCV06841.1 Transglycosylase-associated protein [Mesorhizobium metallidurans STM 2683]
MDVNGVGWIAAIIIGGLAGWLAEMFMKSDTGIFMNIVLGIVGAIVLNAILQALNIGAFGVGWFAYLITGFIGACLLIWVGRLVRR